MNRPARTIKKSAVKNIVRFPAIKSNNGQTILLESILESKYCLHLEFNPQVVSYSPQPKTFSLAVEGAPKSYTPDFEVNFESGERTFVEVKPLQYASSQHYQLLFSTFSTHLSMTCRSHFKLVSEIEIYNQPLLSNYEKLYQYRKRPELDIRNLHKCADKFQNSTTLEKLILHLNGIATVREIYSWLALGHLIFDIEHSLLNLQTEVSFNV